jgi:copper(I)-binding protein
MKTHKFCHQRRSQLLLTFLIAIALIGCSAGDNDVAASINSAAKTGGTLGQTANDHTASQVEGMHLIDPRIHAPAPGQPMSAGYFILMNHGSEAVTLTGFISDTVAVQMHTTKVENNGTTMRPLNGITIAADDQIIFKPGGNHLMVRGLPRDLKSIPLTMQFEHGASLETTFTVLSIDEWMEKQIKPGMDHVDH